VVASLGLADDAAAGRHRFVADPNLFNVLVTRARRRMVVPD
jgi:superfamily I DNA and/or RNA helicase